MADFTNNSGVALAGRITANRDLVTHPNLLKWAYEGKLWTAGVGVENAGIDSLAALADVTPDFGLVTSSSATTLILPIMIRMSVHTEGGALNQLQVAVTRAAADCATTMALSAGTAFTAVQNHNVAYMTSPTASAKYTITVSALTNADYQSIMLATQADNPVSGTGGLGFNRGTVFEIDLLATPRILHSGAALFIYTYTGTTDQKYLPAITWAELTADDLR